MDVLTPLLAFGAGAGAARLLTGLREHRTEPAGLDDLLSWAFLVTEGVVLQKDGSFLAGWRYRGPDTAASAAAELDALSRQVAHALLPYGDGWMFHADAVRRPSSAYAPPGAFPDAVTALLDEERRRAYEGGRAFFETDYFLVATYLPPPELYSRLGRLFVKGAPQQGALEGGGWAQALLAFEQSLRGLQDRLSATLTLSRLGSEGLLTHLHACFTGLHHVVRAPHPGVPLSYALAEQPLVGGFRPRIGGLHVRPVAVQGFPPATHGGMTSFLGEVPHAFRWSSRLLPLGYRSAAREIRRRQLGWFQKRKGAAALVREAASGSGRTKSAESARDEALFHDLGARHMAEDAQEAMALLSSGEARFYSYTGVALVMEPSEEEADQAAAALVKAATERGFAARVEDVNALEAYLGTLPGHGYPNLRRPLLPSPCVADLLPTTSVWPGHATNPSPYFPPDSPALMWTATGSATPFRLNLHEGDVGHTLIIGATGAGKSVLVGTLVAQWFRYPGAQVFLFDLGYSGYLLAKASGAAHYDVAGGDAADEDLSGEASDAEAPADGGGVRFQPLAGIHDEGERAWAAQWLEGLFELQGVAVTPAVRERTRRALRLLAGCAREDRTLSELAVQVQDSALKGALRPFTAGGALAGLLDASKDGFARRPYQVFEMRHLSELPDRLLTPLLLYLFHRIEHRLSGGRPTLIVVEEAWAALLRSRFAERLRRWLLTLRKRNAAVVLVAHSPQQLAALEDGRLITESCPTRIFLPSPDAASREAAALYEGLGLSRAEAELLARARPKRDYYYASPSGRRLFDLQLGPAARAFLGSRPGLSMQETRREAEALMREHGEAWPVHWLRRCGLAGEAEALGRLRDALNGRRPLSPIDDVAAPLPGLARQVPPVFQHLVASNKPTSPRR